MADALVPMEQCICAYCFIPFMVPARLLSQKREDGTRFSCPNGHQLEMPKPKPEARSLEARQREIKALHDAEQAEARAADAAAKAEAGIPPEPTPAPAPQEPRITHLSMEDKRNRLRCPLCDRAFAMPGRNWLRGHLMRAHNWTEDDAQNVSRLPIKRAEVQP